MGIAPPAPQCLRAWYHTCYLITSMEKGEMPLVANTPARILYVRTMMMLIKILLLNSVDDDEK